MTSFTGFRGLMITPFQEKKLLLDLKSDQQFRVKWQWQIHFPMAESKWAKLPHKTKVGQRRLRKSKRKKCTSH
jgi:hypothetical protein